MPFIEDGERRLVPSREAVAEYRVRPESQEAPRRDPRGPGGGR